MNPADLTSWVLIGVIALISYQGFQDPQIVYKLLFDVGEIRRNKDYLRLLSSGFIHADWNHLLFNMLTLYFFADAVIAGLGIYLFLLVYFISLVGGNLLSLLLHKDEYNYKALGASGAVSGIVFSAIALVPGMKIGFIFIPIPFPAWIYGFGFVLYSIYGIRTRRDNIGHDAHLGGGILGVLATVAIFPELLYTNTLAISLILIPAIIFLLILKFKPELLNIRKY
ncbi:rhomboid family intramembrane serine protease [bacterium]|nr:rhomboid family intramembrane serine protease [bacterium]